MLDELKEQLVKAQNRMKALVDKHRREVELLVGEKVFLKIQPYDLKSLAERQNQKLSPWYYGPSEVLEKIAEVAYRLKLPPDSNIHRVSHVSLLKRCISSSAVSQPLPKCLTDGWELYVIPEAVTATRLNAAGEQEGLVKWADLPDFESAWELKTTIQQSFPDSHLEDKVELQEGMWGIVRDPKYGKVYVGKRRGRFGLQSSPQGE